MAVLDPLVFDVGTFDATDPIPTLLDVRVEPEHGVVAVGQGINITIRIVNLSTTPGHRYLFNPSTLPKITIYSPSGVAVVTAQDMLAYATGVYTYNHAILSAVSGAYTGSFYCQNGAYYMQTLKHFLYKVV